MDDPFLATAENLARFHGAHERFYAQEPRRQAVELQRHARALAALADRWEAVEPDQGEVRHPFQGAEDLNASAALQLDGVLFMDAQGAPVELVRLCRDLRTAGDDAVETGTWLAEAMEASWAVLPALLDRPELADLVGERHRIVANDWQAAAASSLAGRLLHRAVDVLDRVDLAPAALRADLAGARTSPRLVRSAVELIDRAADLLSESAGLVHDNDRRWRAFRARVEDLASRDGS